MIDVEFYNKQINDLTEQVREAVLNVCEHAKNIEGNGLSDRSASDMSAILEGLSHEAEMVKAFADSVYFLSRLLREKIKA